MDINNLTICGRLVSNPEIVEKNEIKILKFTIANNQKNNTNFINCVAFNKLAELINQYCNKGSRVNLIGHIQTRNYEDQNGQKRYVTEVVAENVQFLDNKKDGQQSEQEVQQNNTQANNQLDPYEEMGRQVSMNEYDTSELPF